MQRADCEAQEPAHLRLADRDVAGGEIEEDLGAGKCGSGTRRLRHPQILADLDMKGKAGVAAGGEQKIAAERRFMAGDHDRLAGHPFARGEVPALVEFAVIWQKHLGNDAEEFTEVDRHAAIIEVPAGPEGRPDDKHREEFPAGTDQPIDLP